ncbi:hypothetical protein ACHHYP_10098 [Achlya hypogyna]|uniref:RING-type E3 ubiquitin transferase n=1 Tax=Achlya hypogyna TaxID=1202772 RepID=A0A1V9ZIA1_ACHHY|nr:hypothetical protein ACHHYP_10098 [Achlya hypogyna]
MGQSCSCLDESHRANRRRNSSPLSLQAEDATRTQMDSRASSKASAKVIEPTVVKRNPRTLDHESAYTAFVYKGMEPPKKVEASSLSEPRSSSETTIVELECVMCLDTFSDDNPKIRTLCNCGVNRTNFHLACLYEWVDRDKSCPVCRAVLFFEEN